MEKGKDKVGVIGGGIAGLSVGWQLLRSGWNVTIHERGKTGQGASKVAAGMLAPTAEVGFEELDLMALGGKSLSLYPEFLKELREDAGKAPSLDACGTLLVAGDRDDRESLQRLYDFRKRAAVRAEWLTGSEAREWEPMLAPKVNSAVWLPDDAQIDNWQLLDDLRKAFLKRGGDLREEEAVEALEVGDGAYKVRTASGEYLYDRAIIAAGAYSGALGKGKGDVDPGIWPVKGQLLSVGYAPELPIHRMIRSPRVYLVPKEKNNILVGATSEDRGFDKKATAGGMKDILEEAWYIYPGLYELSFEGVQVECRPGSGDNGPVLGRDDRSGIWWATGHYRHGILLAPVTAYGIKEMMNRGGECSIPEISPFLVHRFDREKENPG